MFIKPCYDFCMSVRLACSNFINTYKDQRKSRAEIVEVANRIKGMNFLRVARDKNIVEELASKYPYKGNVEFKFEDFRTNKGKQ